jgi:hypothetical protein
VPHERGDERRFARHGPSGDEDRPAAPADDAGVDEQGSSRADRHLGVDLGAQPLDDFVRRAIPEPHAVVAHDVVRRVRHAGGGRALDVVDDVGDDRAVPAVRVVGQDGRRQHPS